MNKLILVVDDERDSRDVLRTYLESSGFNVRVAEDGYEALEKALDECPDLVIMDMAMPLVDGINSTRAMREHEHLRKTPIIGLTAFGSFYSPRAFDAGCTEVLTKPVDFVHLDSAVAKHLRLSERRV